jgi:hypothetical protein
MAGDKMSHSYSDFHKPFIINGKHGICDSAQSNVLATKLDGYQLTIPEPGYLVVSTVLG